jgi:hypothetical protein
MYVPMHGLMAIPSRAAYDMAAADDSSPNAMSTNTDGQPTPNSSSASDPTRQQAGLSAGGRNASSGRTSSFEASPSAAPTQQTEAEAAAAAFFADSGGVPGFVLPDVGGEGEAGAGGAYDDGWEMPGQAGMTPGTEGVLRSIMIGMGPMDGMDLRWDAETSLR